jgi:O-antigen/teichoic acid export membrane protein
MIARLRSLLNDRIGDRSLVQLLRNASMLFGAETLATLISLVQFPLVTRLLGPEQYGVWGIATGWVALVAQIISFRLWETLIKYLSQFMVTDDEPRALAMLKLCVWIDFIVAVVTLVVISLSAGLAAGIILKTRPDGADLIRLEALDVFAGLTMSVWVAVLRTFNRFRWLSIYNIVSALAIFIGWMAVLWAHGGVGGLILVTALIKLGQTLGLGWLAQRDLNGRFHKSWLSADLGVLRPQRREISVMLFSMNIDTFRKIVLNNLDIVVLGWLATPAQAGLYRLAEQLAAYMNRLTNPLYDTLYPEVARMYAAEGPAAVAALVKRLQRGILIGLAVVLAGAYLVTPWAVPLIFSTQYTPALPIFYILVLANVWVIGLWVPSVMLSAGRAKHLTVINTLCALLMLVLLFGLVPYFGAVGAAVAQTAFQFVWLVLAYRAAQRLLVPVQPKVA